jgi:hypothetical protein
MDVTAFLGLVHVAGKNGGKAEGGMVSARVCGGERLQICVEARAQHGETILAQFQSETGLVLTHAELQNVVLVGNGDAKLTPAL